MGSRMKKALIVGVLAAIMSAGLCQPVLAGSSTDAALGLGAFAVFNQFLFGQPVLHPALGGLACPRDASQR